MHNQHFIIPACVFQKSHFYNTVFFKACILKQMYHFQLMSSNAKHICVFSVNGE